MTKRTSNAYIMTADVNSVADMQSIALVRKTISIANRRARDEYAMRMKWNPSANLEKPKQYRVLLKPRLGKNNPAYATKYKQQWIKSIKLEDAVRIDVYVQPRS